jgi:hypothetical protein
MEQRVQLREPDVNALLADGEQLRLRPIDRLLDLRRVLVTDPGDAAGRSDQVPQDRLALHDPGVLDRMDGRRRGVGQAREVGATADRLELARPLESLRHGDDVDRLTSLEQLEDGLEDLAVRLPVEVRRPEELRHLDDRIAVDEDRAEHRLLRLEALRGQTIDHGHLGRWLTAVPPPVSRPTRCAR